MEVLESHCDEMHMYLSLAVRVDLSISATCYLDEEASIMIFSIS